ncbi:MAG: glycosyltransferase, partial [Euryarchaeota archaeon]|nr:glycosyltransferase [Euryarchaeota archaeon]
MKVAMVTPYWFPIRGGVTAYVSGLAAELRRSYDVDVHVIAREGGPEGATIVGGTPTEFVRRAAEALETVAPDVVHAHGHWYALQAALRYRGRHPGTRVLFTLHTEFRPRSWLRRRFLHRQLSKADVLTAVSLHLLERTLRTFRPRTGARVTRPGASVRAASPDVVRTFLRA